jgi:hypothetical protein
VTESIRLDAIFAAAIELSRPQDRRSFIARACGPDDDLRTRVEHLVAAHFRAADFLEQAAPGLDDLLIQRQREETNSELLGS